MEPCEILPMGDSAVMLRFGAAIDPRCSARVMAMRAAVDSARIAGVLETVPTYCALVVSYDPAVLRFEPLTARLRELEKTVGEAASQPATVYEIPVCYGGEFGPDLPHVASLHGLREEEVIALHSAPEYRIYMLGFLAGFPYLGGLDPRLETPRLETPRVKIPGGSVGIAGAQTGIYPVASPGGWQLIGRTPLRLYDTKREQPVLLEAGGYLKFRPVTPEEFSGIAGDAPCRTWKKEEPAWAL